MLLAEMTSQISHALRIQQLKKVFLLFKDAQQQPFRQLSVNILAHTMVDQTRIGGNREMHLNTKDLLVFLWIRITVVLYGLLI